MPKYSAAMLSVRLLLDTRCFVALVDGISLSSSSHDSRGGTLQICFNFCFYAHVQHLFVSENAENII